MWKNYCRAGEATDENMAHTHSMPDTYGYRHTLRIFNTAFPRNNRYTTRPPMLRYTYIASLVFLFSFFISGEDTDALVKIYASDVVTFKFQVIPMFTYTKG